ncbi:aminodeoxychorismate lyase [Cognatilysobacter bugurensis]|uniref:Aminodeoxychorismate lyase n=1 Tax=Cognatilysobacter bugurensis TaxID=543356 RepID=A0A918STN2_9GAMM|nr:aminodeoxychorismate lyase [Lysobacter bugurensis]GHA69896.1 aminodeoxychorismate lyase [Lysobacter bugurensis]
MRPGDGAAAAVGFHGRERIDAWPLADRGAAYGDGLFETMRAHEGHVPWWDAHWTRLEGGARRLGFALPERCRVEAEAQELLAGGGGVLKLVVTRGSGGRGYMPPADAEPSWALSRHALPAAAPTGGLVLRWCTLRLAVQPALASIKHCNRLEQVLARGEWSDPAVHEGLLTDADDHLVCATAANVFVLRDGRWQTPFVDRCGVAGVCRGWAIERLGAAEARLSRADVEQADAVFVCNAVRGILPVAQLGERTWPPHPQVRALRERLADEHPAFALELS